MATTVEEARAKARAAKIPEEDITPAVLKLYGWEPGNPLADVDLSGPAVTEKQLNEHLAMLVDEAKANSVPNTIIKGIKTVVGLAAKFTPL